MFNNEGEVKLYIFRTRHFPVDDGQGGTLALQSINPVPVSRHVSAQPGVQSIVKTFHQVRGQQEQKQREHDDAQTAAAAKRGEEGT